MVYHYEYARIGAAGALGECDQRMRVPCVCS